MEKISNRSQDNHLVELKDLIWIWKAISKGWYIVLLSPVVVGIIGAFLAYRKTPSYTSQVQVLLKSSEVYNYQSSLYKSVGYAGLYTDISNQMRVIKSYDMVETALRKLNFEVSYYIVGRVNTKEFFNNVPFKIDVTPLASDIHELPIAFDIINSKQYSLTFELGGQTISNTHNFGEDAITGWYKINTIASSVITNSNKTDDGGFAKYEIVIHTRDYWVKRILSNMEVENLEFTSILNVSLKDEIPERSKVFLDTLSRVYLDYTLQSQIDINENTMVYIDKQIDEVTTIMDSITLEIDTIRDRKDILDIQKESSVYFTQLMEFKEKKRNAKLTISSLESLKSYIINSDDASLLPPSYYIPSNDDYLEKSLTKFYTTQLEKINLQTVVKPDHQSYTKLEASLILQRQSLLVYIENTIDAIEDKIVAFGKQIGYYEALVKKMPKTQREVNAVNRTMLVNEKLYVFLLEKRANTFIAKSGIVPQTKIIEKPRVVEVEGGDYFSQGFIFGGIGLLFGIGLSLFKHWRFSTIDSSKELASLSILPVLGSIPVIKDVEGADTQIESKSNFAEALRGIRTSMSYSAVGKDNRALMVTSIHAGEGKTFSSTSLAKLFAKSSRKVLIVDFDLHKPKVHKMFKLENQKGNSNFLSDQVSIKDVIQKVNENLSVITSGPVPPNPSELILSDKVDELIQYGLDNYDHILLDTPPIGLISDGVVLMNKVNMAIFVMNAKVANSRGLSYLEDIVEKVGINSTGLILNGVKLKRWKYHYGKYGYAYGYGYGQNYGQTTGKK